METTNRYTIRPYPFPLRQIQKQLHNTEIPKNRSPNPLPSLRNHFHHPKSKSFRSNSQRTNRSPSVFAVPNTRTPLHLPSLHRRHQNFKKRLLTSLSTSTLPLPKSAPSRSTLHSRNGGCCPPQCRPSIRRHRLPLALVRSVGHPLYSRSYSNPRLSNASNNRWCLHHLKPR